MDWWRVRWADREACAVERERCAAASGALMVAMVVSWAVSGWFDVEGVSEAGGIVPVTFDGAVSGSEAGAVCFCSDGG